MYPASPSINMQFLYTQLGVLHVRGDEKDTEKVERSDEVHLNKYIDCRKKKTAEAHPSVCVISL